MIQVYAPNNTTYTANGNAVLMPLSCTISAELNGSWTMELVHPIDEEGRWKFIETNAVIKAPGFIGGDQLYRIKQTSKADSGITATAEPIFLDSIGDCFMFDVRPRKVPGQVALDTILSFNNKYSGTTDITKTATAYYIRKNAMEAIAGEENSFIERWGGEILYNNYQIIINKKIGTDNGHSVLYGKNIQTDGLVESVDMNDVVTRLIPKSFNGHLMSGNRPWVDSENINRYPTVLTKVVDFENIKLRADLEGDEEEDNAIICDTQAQLDAALREAAEAEFAEGIDKPTVTIDINMVALSTTREYADYKDLEKVSLGDVIHCKHNKLGIVTDARVKSLVFDCITETVTAVTIGEIKPAFLDRVSSSVRATEKALTKSGAVKAEQIEGFIDGAMAQLRLQNTVAKKQDVRAILFEDLDPNSDTYGALAIGTQGWQISKIRNETGTEWVWSTAATAGGIIADYINAGTLEAIDINGVTITGSEITGGSLATEGIITGTQIRSQVIIRDGSIYVYKDRATSGEQDVTIDGRGIYFDEPGTQSARLTLNSLSISDDVEQNSAFVSRNVMSQTRGNTLIWQNVYQSGDSVTLGNECYSGFISSSSEKVHFFIPLNTSPYGLAASITFPSNFSGRTVAGYLDGTQNPDTSVYRATASTRWNGVHVTIDKLIGKFVDANGNTIANNTPVNIFGNFTINFTTA